MFKGSLLTKDNIKVGVKYSIRSSYRQFEVVCIHPLGYVVSTGDNLHVYSKYDYERTITYHPDDPIEFEDGVEYYDDTDDILKCIGTLKKSGSVLFWSQSCEQLELHDPKVLKNWRKIGE